MASKGSAKPPNCSCGALDVHQRGLLSQESQRWLGAGRQHTFPKDWGPRSGELGGVDRSF